MYETRGLKQDCNVGFLEVVISTFNYFQFMASKENSQLDQLNSNIDQFSELVLKLGNDLSKQVALFVEEDELDKLLKTTNDSLKNTKPVFISGIDPSTDYAAKKQVKLKVAEKLWLLMNLVKSEKKERSKQIATGK